MIPARPATRNELRVRFLACILVTAGVFFLLMARLFYLQVVAGNRYRDLSENNRIRIERIAPQRGVIFDRNGQLLAGTHVSFDADLVPTEVPRERAAEIFSKAAALLSMTEEEVRRVAAQKNPPPWLARVLKRRLSREEMARLDARRLDLPGIFVTATPVRHYPYGRLMGPTLGYLGTITPEELEGPAFAEYDPNDYIGRAGLERVWEGMLRGTAGGTHVEVDVLGRRLKEVAEKPASAGQNIVLTVDLRVQQAAEEAMGDQAGSVVALDVMTGEVLAMVSRPAYDPNELTVGLDSEAWNKLAGDPLHPLNNRPTQGTYAPGSTFKIVMALAGLDTGTITPMTRFNCNGSYMFGGRAFRCWKREGHGSVDLEHAIEQSCDVYFYQLGAKLGIDAIHDYAVRLGLGGVTGIDLPNEKEGTIPSSEWKRRVLNAPWYAGETISVAIGQGYVTVTPLQLAAMTAAVAHPRGAACVPTSSSESRIPWVGPSWRSRPRKWGAPSSSRPTSTS